MTALPEINRVPTVAEVDRITALPDPVIRNLQITQCYHELAAALTTRTGVQANWCAFATWASKQAGQTIRKEDLARTLENLLRAAPSVQSLPDAAATTRAFGSSLPEDEIQETLAEVLNPLAAFDRASDAVGRGNKKVYEEIARVFADFCAECLHDMTYDSATIAQFCGKLRPGNPPDGQEYLRQAFTSYYRALFETDPKTQSELLLLANIEIGFHEQTRLQPEILEAMDAAFVDPQPFRLRVIKALFPNRGWTARIRLFLLRLFRRPSPFDQVLDALVIEARRRAHLLITEYMMTISFPGTLLRLGHDVPGEFPVSLQQIALPDLRALLDQIDTTPDSTRDTGAVDWSRLPDRLHYIADLFRCYHEWPALFDPPFTPAQVAALKAGRLPEDRL
ncbi:MAG: hypothetical protein H6671_10015 [Anaerolineaceae bacterium]|nr:hypothetical protein [Anaerolineaceae bacterium]